MAKQKYDGVVEAVHYTPEGQVEWVRAYLRRMVIFSDRVMLDRPTLIEYLKSGKRFVIGRRIEGVGANFEVSGSLNVQQKNGQDILVVGDVQADHDRLDGVPII